MSIRSYYVLTKPGIIRGNAIHVLAGAFMASMYAVDWVTLAGVVVGTSLVIASACVANNYMDRDMDAKMGRTKQRPSVTGAISVQNALTFSMVLLIAGFSLLALQTNAIVIVIGIVAYILYVFAYGYAKRRTVHSTLIGAIPGALPAMAGYVAIDGTLSLGAWLMFLLVFTWQMPHFYAISLFRKKDYAAAGVPVLGVVRPFSIVRRYIFAYMIAYLLVIVAMISADVVAPAAALILLAGSGYWLATALRVNTHPNDTWARAVFGSSLVLTIGLLVASIITIFMPPQA